ncbi:MAG: ribbon-helix-helix protein, CopG family [Microbacteriaceae bacterium]|nr:ribbon-helix-helix protein, CopG family [Microbacteriaceae bacterium]
MRKRIVNGQEISDEQVQRWADEAERGYDVDHLQKIWGRPLRAETASRVVPTRFSDAELAGLMARAEREGLNRSAAIRAAVNAWAHA